MTDKTKVEQIRDDFQPVHEGINDLVKNEDEIEGMAVMVCTKNGNYYSFVAGTVFAEQAIGRLEVLKRELLARIK